MEIYDKPKSTFVASFIGNSNLFHGILQRENADRFVFVAEGLRLPFPSTFSDKLNQKMNLLLRPEHLQLKSIDTKGPDAEFGVEGTITFVTLLGLSAEYEIKLDSGANIKIEERRNRDQTPLQEGARVLVSPIDADCYLIIPE
jgi:spermidine/putrescine transport system ATP-binding protein